MKNYSTDLIRLKEEISKAEAIIIGAGSGLSTAAGFTYDGERFIAYFQDFIDAYHFTDMYTATFYPFETHEEYWAYWSRHIYINRYIDAPIPVYNQLLNIVKDKNYFVITTNVDHCFQKAGFAKERLFYTQGDYGLFQCSTPCHNKTYDNEKIIKKMLVEQKNMKIPAELIPLCPICHAPMTTNLRKDDKFVQDEGWYQAKDRYLNFLKENLNKRVLFLELGVGFNTPGIIKYPFWQMTDESPKATYVSVNLGEAYIPQNIKDKSISINADIKEVIEKLSI